MSIFAKPRIPKRRALPCCGVSPLNNLIQGWGKWRDANQLSSNSLTCQNCGYKHGYSADIGGVSVIQAPIFKEHSS